jgi:hypothetical protein
MEFKEGLYEDIPYEQYDSIPAFRSHDLTSVIKCPYTWKNKKGLTPSPALLEGRVQHTVFLEHHKFDEEFVIQPNIDRRTKVGKAEYEDFLATVGNRTPITQDLYDLCMERRELVKEYIPKEDQEMLLSEVSSKPSTLLTIICKQLYMLMPVGHWVCQLVSLTS